MGDRTPLLFDLAALPTTNIGDRQRAYDALRATGNEAQVRAKIRNFVARGFITNEDPLAMTLTAAGRSAKDSQ